MKSLRNAFYPVLIFVVPILIIGIGLFPAEGNQGNQDIPDKGIFQRLNIGQRVDLKEHENSVTIRVFPKKLTQGSLFTVHSKTDTYIVLVDTVGKTMWIPESSVKLVEFWADINERKD